MHEDLLGRGIQRIATEELFAGTHGACWGKLGEIGNRIRGSRLRSRLILYPLDSYWYTSYASITSLLALCAWELTPARRTEAEALRPEVNGPTLAYDTAWGDCRKIAKITW